MRRRNVDSPPYNDEQQGQMSRGRSPLFSAQTVRDGAGSSSSSNGSGSQVSLGDEVKPVNIAVRFWRSISGKSFGKFG